MPNIITRKVVKTNIITPIHKKEGYANNDLGSVFTHYDKTTGKNVATENKILNNNGGIK